MIASSSLKEIIVQRFNRELVETLYARHKKKAEASWLEGSEFIEMDVNFPTILSFERDDDINTSWQILRCSFAEIHADPDFGPITNLIPLHLSHPFTLYTWPTKEMFLTKVRYNRIEKKREINVGEMISFNSHFLHSLYPSECRDPYKSFYLDNRLAIFLAIDSVEPLGVYKAEEELRLQLKSGLYFGP